MAFKTLIGVDSLRKLLGEPRSAVIDCRFDLMNPDAGRQAYLSGHIPEARYAHLNRDLSAPIGPRTGRHPLPAPYVFGRSNARPTDFSAWTTSQPMPPTTRLAVSPGV